MLQRPPIGAGFRRAPPIPVAMAFALAAGSACSEPRLQRRPADVVFSVGVADGAVGPPQASGPLTLTFGDGEPGPAVVVAVRRSGAVPGDGAPAAWAGIPASQIPLGSAAARVGLDEPGFLCRYRSRLALAVDPYTSAPGCPTACDPAHPPASREEASAGCTLPFPRFDHGIAQVTVQAAFDDERLYLLLRWSDPTEDRGARTWRYDAGGGAAWMAGDDAEDRASVSFDAGSRSAHATLGCTAACHLAGPVAAPPPGTPAGLVPPAYLAQFTMHTAGDSERIDAWEWRGSADRQGLADDLFWNALRSQGDCPTPPACSDACLLSPPGPDCASAGAALENAQDGLPRYLAAGASGLGDPDLDPAFLFLSGQGLPGWDPALTAWSPGEDPFPAPAGGAATLPGVVLQRPSAHRDDVAATGRWSAGQWTVELSRALVTGDADDAQFPLR